jgi:tetratricopeptide (TPR) repeat protein
MRAFLSHSSKNKDFVRKVYDNLGSALAEFDEKTFEAGSFNVSAIDEGLDRSDLFVLFATPESLKSGYVELETRLAQERLAGKKIKKIMTFCLQDVRPEQLPGILPSIAAVLRISSPGAISRAIRSNLFDLSLENGESARPFVGRNDEKRSISIKLTDPQTVSPTALMMSGVDGAGRRTLAKKVFEDIFPHLPKVLPSISIIAGSGAPEIYRELLSVSSSLSKSELFKDILDFDQAEEDEKNRRIGSLVEEISSQDQILFVVDDGGLLLDDGSLNETMKSTINYFHSKNVPHPPLCFITFRTPPGKVRERNGVIYHRVEPLASDDIKMLISLHLKRKRLKVDPIQIDKIADLIDGHPYNLEYILDLLDTASMESILDDPSDMIAFKMRQGDEFLSRIKLTPSELALLSTLRVLGTSPIQILSEVVIEESIDLGRTIKSLEEKHCIERSGEVISINRPLRAAIERSSQLRLNKGEVTAIREKVVEIFKEFQDDDDIPVSLISTAARAAALSQDEDKFLRLFISPANAVLAARQLYNVKDYTACETMCERALKQDNLITPEAALEARRLRCLSLIRLGRDDEFQDEVSRISTWPKRSNALKLFLLGFRQRIRGFPSEACDFYQRSLSDNPKAFATLREAAQSWLMQGVPSKAKEFNDRALALAPANPYVLDQALAIEISQKGQVDSYIFYDPTVENLLEGLKKYGNEDGLSFFSIRMADICKRTGDTESALRHLQDAKRLNPSHVPAYLMECEILLDAGASGEANEKVEAIRPMIEGNKSGEGNTNLPEFLSLKVRVLAEGGNYQDAVRLLMASQSRLGGRLQELKKYITFLLGSAKDLKPSEIDFLKN